MSQYMCERMLAVGCNDCRDYSVVVSTTLNMVKGRRSLLRERLPSQLAYVSMTHIVYSESLLSVVP